MSRIVKRKSFVASCLQNTRHISRVTSDLFWINDRKDLILMDTAGDEVFHLEDAVNGHQVHSVNSDGDLIYIDDKKNINKYSMKKKAKITKILLVEYIKPWSPRCVFSSPYNGDLLVAMFDTDSGTARVNRFNQKGKNIQNIQFDNKGKKLYDYIKFVIENCNGDVIVSDYYIPGVVVTDRNGRHRFSYKGYPPGTDLLQPGGICTDPLSRILVCDPKNHTVHMIDKDGNFLSMILTLQQGIYQPLGLCFDKEKNLILVGSEDNSRVDIFRFISGESLSERCRSHPQKEAEKFCFECDVEVCVDCISSEGHSRHNVKDIYKSQDYPLLKLKCKKHPTNKPQKFCVDCDVPVCMDCIISKEHIFHFVKGFPLQNAKCEYHEESIITHFCIICDEPLCEKCRNLKSHSYHLVIDVLERTGSAFRNDPGINASDDFFNMTLTRMLKADVEQNHRLTSIAANLKYKDPEDKDKQKCEKTGNRGNVQNRGKHGEEDNGFSYLGAVASSMSKGKRKHGSIKPKSREEIKHSGGAVGEESDAYVYQPKKRKKQFPRQTEGMTRLYTMKPVESKVDADDLPSGSNTVLSIPSDTMVPPLKESPLNLTKTLVKAKEGSPRKSCTYPFSKRASQKDALTSHLKAEVIRSVGLIYVDEHPVGTGFRVGEKYIMTCLHVIKKIIQGPLDFIRFERVYIQFERMLYLQNTDERKIFHFEPSIVYKHEGFDVALLELKKQEIQFPPPLTLFGANCLSSEEVHLIGHPGGAQMKEDSEVYPSVIEPNNDVDKYIKELSDWSREKFMNNVDYYSRLRELPRKILFHTTFDQGSSGSPGILIRNHKPCVVLIVAGGVPSVYYEDGVYVEPEKRVEFGYALRDVFDEMQMDENDKKLSSEIFKEWIS